MKKLIPFTLERWQQGNCTVKTADGRQVNQLTHFDTKDMYCFRGVVGDDLLSWNVNGIFWSDNTSPRNLMLEVYCEVVYVSLLRGEFGLVVSETRRHSGGAKGNPNFIKEIKVEL
jgi:hypothetical protein